MSSPESFEDLDAWKLARELTNEVYGFCRRDPLCRDFGLADQIRRAAVSVMNNIAEGWESIGLGEKRQAYGYARRSCGEVRSMTYVLLDNHFITLEEQAALLGHCIRTGKLISGLLRSVDNRRQPISER
ncbi:MAG: four helix bundle protein [Limisphaerales bacterium]|jgi:four helix bundle protein